MTEFIRRCQQMGKGTQLKDKVGDYNFTIYRFQKKPLFKIKVVWYNCERSWIVTDGEFENYIRSVSVGDFYRD